MKKFLFVAVLPSLIIAFVIHGLLIAIVDGKTDPFYLRFTSSNSTNLLIGTSRVAQGLQPKVINEILDIETYNFAFTVAHSPFGEVYTEAIFKKLNTNIDDQVFIIGVNPWSISSKSEDPNAESDYRENMLALANVKEYTETPNFEYMRKYLEPKNILKSYLNQNPYMVLREDGWLEVNVDMDSVEVEKRIKSKMREYREQNLPNYQYSSSRKESLFNLVKRLNQYGEVYLVRLPVHPEMMTIENELLPFFQDSIEDVIDASSGYLDLTVQNSDFTYTDGNHLHKSSGKVVSGKIADWICSHP